MIKIFLIKSFVYTPFTNNNDLAYLKEHGIIVTTDISKADILISQNYKHLIKFFFKFLDRKHFLVWTLEPRFDTSFTSVKKIMFGIHKCHFMNIYTGDVFVSIPSFHIHQFKNNLSLLSRNFQVNNRKIVALMSYYNGIKSKPLVKNGENIDLIGLRSHIAIEGHELGILDIYGKGWPDNISIEDSRSGNWPQRKAEILSNYAFNLCFENTIAYNYVTEKIWDSIENYCLPIYYGKNTNIYTIFPKNSFIDFADYKDIPSLFNYLLNISDEEYIDRLNKCIYIYNSINNKKNTDEVKSRKKILNNIIKKCNGIISN